MYKYLIIIFLFTSIVAFAQKPHVEEFGFYTGPITFSLDGKYVATCGIKSLPNQWDSIFTTTYQKVWDVETGKLVFTAKDEADVSKMAKDYGCSVVQRNIDVYNTPLQDEFYTNFGAKIFDPTTQKGIIWGKRQSDKRFIFAKYYGNKWQVLNSEDWSINSKVTKKLKGVYLENIDNYYLSSNGEWIVGEMNQKGMPGEILYNPQVLFIMKADGLKVKDVVNSIKVVDFKRESPRLSPNYVTFSTDNKLCYVSEFTDKEGYLKVSTIDLNTAKVINVATYTDLKRMNNFCYILPNSRYILVAGKDHYELNLNLKTRFENARETRNRLERAWLSRGNFGIYDTQTKKMTLLADSEENLLEEKEFGLTKEKNKGTKGESDEDRKTRKKDELNNEIQAALRSMYKSEEGWTFAMDDVSLMYDASVSDYAFAKTNGKFFGAEDQLYTYEIWAIGKELEGATCYLKVGDEMQVKHFTNMSSQAEAKGKKLPDNYKSFLLRLRTDTKGYIVVHGKGSEFVMIRGFKKR